MPDASIDFVDCDLILLEHRRAELSESRQSFGGVTGAFSAADIDVIDAIASQQRQRLVVVEGAAVDRDDIVAAWPDLRLHLWVAAAPLLLMTGPAEYRCQASAGRDTANTHALRIIGVRIIFANRLKHDRITRCVLTQPFDRGGAGGGGL